MYNTHTERERGRERDKAEKGRSPLNNKEVVEIKIIKQKKPPTPSDLCKKCCNKRNNIRKRCWICESERVSGGNFEKFKTFFTQKNKIQLIKNKLNDGKNVGL